MTYWPHPWAASSVGLGVGGGAGAGDLNAAHVGRLVVGVVREDLVQAADITHAYSF